MLHVDYSTLAVLGTLGLGPAVGAWGRALRAEASLQERYQDRRANATAAIVGSRIVPVVARIVVVVHPRITWPWQGKPGEQADEIEDHLQSVSAGRMLDEITPLAADADSCSRLQREIKGRLWGQAWAAMPYSACVALLILEISSSGLGLPSWAYWSAALFGSCAISVWLVFLAQEITARNRLARIFERYG